MIKPMLSQSSGTSTMPDQSQTSPFHRCSTDPVYLSSHFFPHPHPPFRPRAPAAFHKTSLQARNYLEPPSSSSSSSPTEYTPDTTSLSTLSADDDGSNSDPPVIPAQVSTRIESWHQRRPSFEPLWEESDSFSPSKVSEFRELGRRVNALAREARLLCGGSQSANNSRDDQRRVTTDYSTDEGQEAIRGRRKGSGCFRVSLSPVFSYLSQSAMFALIMCVVSCGIGNVLWRRRQCCL